MEKIKWIILAVLGVTLVVVIFLSSKDDKVEIRNNYAEIEISYSQVLPGGGKVQLLKEGKYTLFLEEFQQIEGKGSGWHLRFSAPEVEREMILVFDVVDTTGQLFTDFYPQKIAYKSDIDSVIKSQPELYRGSFLVGYLRRLSEKELHEDVVPMLDFKFTIDTAWVKDEVGGFRMSFSATHSDMLADVYGMRYVMNGIIDVDSAKVTKRILQHQ